MAGYSRIIWQIVLPSALVMWSFLLSSCYKDNDELIVYTSVDQHYSEPLFKAFEAATGISIRAVYDIEASKTTGMTNRLIAEASNPQADVFWSGETMQMHRLLQNGVLAPYRPPNLPASARALAGDNWIEFGGRIRVLIVNTEKLGHGAAPDSILDLASDTWPGNEIAIAYPMFGTTATHAVALARIWGNTQTLDYFSRLKQRGVRYVAGNSSVRDLVVSGQALFGITDTDDACVAVARGHPVSVIVPDQQLNGLGAFVIPNGVALIASGKNHRNAKTFIDYLTGPEVMSVLAKAGWIYVNGHTVIANSTCGLPKTLKVMPHDIPDTPTTLKEFQSDLKALVVQ